MRYLIGLNAKILALFNSDLVNDLLQYTLAENALSCHGRCHAQFALMMLRPPLERGHRVTCWLQYTTCCTAAIALQHQLPACYGSSRVT
jgi:hypothetical protein